MSINGIGTHNRIAYRPSADRVQSNERVADRVSSQGIVNRVHNSAQVANQVSSNGHSGKLNIAA